MNCRRMASDRSQMSLGANFIAGGCLLNQRIAPERLYDKRPTGNRHYCRSRELRLAANPKLSVLNRFPTSRITVQFRAGVPAWIPLRLITAFEPGKTGWGWFS